MLLKIAKWIRPAVNMLKLSIFMLASRTPLWVGRESSPAHMVMSWWSYDNCACLQCDCFAWSWKGWPLVLFLHRGVEIFAAQNVTSNSWKTSSPSFCSLWLGPSNPKCKDFVKNPPRIYFDTSWVKCYWSAGISSNTLQLHLEPRTANTLSDREQNICQSSLGKSINVNVYRQIAVCRPISSLHFVLAEQIPVPERGHGITAERWIGFQTAVDSWLGVYATLCLLTMPSFRNSSGQAFFTLPMKLFFFFYDGPGSPAGHGSTLSFCLTKVM